MKYELLFMCRVLWEVQLVVVVVLVMVLLLCICQAGHMMEWGVIEENCITLWNRLRGCDAGR